MAHITGGGLLENIPRVMPARTKALINSNRWEMPAVFSWLQKVATYKWKKCIARLTVE